MSTYDFCDVFTLHFQIHRIQVWYICLRFVFDPYGKCWQIYHTWIKVERICYGPQDAFLCQGQFPDGYGWPLPDATQLQFTFPVPCMKYRVLYCLYYKNGYGLWNPNKLTRMSFEMFVWNVCVCVFSSFPKMDWHSLRSERVSNWFPVNWFRRSMQQINFTCRQTLTTWKIGYALDMVEH